MDTTAGMARPAGAVTPRSRWAAVWRWALAEGAVWPAAIFAVALVLRLGMVAYVNPDPRDGRFDDSVWYDSTARSMADGRGYVWDPTVWRFADGTPIYPGDTEVAPSALWPPGYPVLLAAIYKLTAGSLVAAKLANVLFGALTAALACLIGRRLFGERAGIAAGFAVAFMPTHILFTTVTMSEVFFTFLLVLMVYFVLRWTVDDDRPHPAQLIGLGVLTGFAALTRGELAVIAIALFALYLVLGRSWRTAGQWTLLIVLGMTAIFVPWTVRNCIQMDSCIVGTTGVGRAFAQGHGPDSDGAPSLKAVLLFESRFSGLPRVEREVRSHEEGQRESIKWALKHPREEALLFFKRLHLMYRNDQSGVEWVQSNKPTFGELGAERLANLSNAYYSVLLALAVLGAPAWLAMRRGRTVWVALMPIVYYTLVFGVLFLGSNRYHVPILPFLAIMAAPALAMLAAIVQQQWRSLREGAPLSSG